MSLLDKAKKAVIEHKDDIEKGIDKVEGLAHDKLPDKHEAKIDTAAEKAKGLLDKLAGGPKDTEPAEMPETTT